MVSVRATVHLPGLPLGSTAFVDPGDPYIDELLTHGYLVPVTKPSTAARRVG